MILRDVDGVGVVEGFRDDTPQDIIDEYNEYVRSRRKRSKGRIRHA